jgi:hypothetical protein
MIWVKKHKGIFFCALTVVLFVLCKFVPIVAWAYHHSLFALWRWIWDYTLAQIPIAFFPIAILLLIFSIWKWRKVWMDLIAIWVALFFWLWGFHYALPPHIPLSSPYSTIQTEALYKATLMAADSTSYYLQNAQGALFQMPLAAHYLQREALESELKNRGIHPFGKPVVRSSGESDLLRKIGIGGIYMPYASEGYFDGTFLPDRQVFVLHHELSHAYGVTDEGECDYMAFCALRKGNQRDSLADVVVRYAAWLEMYLSLRGELLAHFPEAKARIDAYEEPLLAAKMDALRQNAKDHPTWFPDAAVQMNNAYLQTMGVEGGVKSYDRMVSLYMQENWESFSSN